MPIDSLTVKQQKIVPEREQEAVPLEQCEGILVARGGHCIGCKACSRACPMGLLDESWADVGTVRIAPVCRNCSEPWCVAACKRGAMRKAGIRVIVDTELCVGCGICAVACPFGTIRTNKVHCRQSPGNVSLLRPINVVVKCDRCRGQRTPACCKECPTGALGFVSGKELRELIQNSVPNADYGTNRHYLLNRLKNIGDLIVEQHKKAKLTLLAEGLKFLYSRQSG